MDRIQWYGVTVSLPIACECDDLMTIEGCFGSRQRHHDAAASSHTKFVDFLAEER
jgi:hypothetical protein